MTAGSLLLTNLFSEIRFVFRFLTFNSLIQVRLSLLSFVSRSAGTGQHIISENGFPGKGTTHPETKRFRLCVLRVDYTARNKQVS